jgi:hypothetical protein
MDNGATPPLLGQHTQLLTALVILTGKDQSHYPERAVVRRSAPAASRTSPGPAYR